MSLGTRLRILKNNIECEYYSIKYHRRDLEKNLKEACYEYDQAYEKLSYEGGRLHRSRVKSVELIGDIETLINSIAKFPKKFDDDISEINAERKKFTNACEFSKKEVEQAKKSAFGAGAGVAAGAAFTSFAPTAAMWVATTFGTASTGTAISALSGAAATNAALAWLGGGALAAGGGGMAAGSAFLALAGPIGWGIAGASAISSAVMLVLKKKKITDQKNSEIRKVKINTDSIKKMTAEIIELIEETNRLRDELKKLYEKSCYMRDKSYDSFSVEEQLLLGSLVNNTKSMAASVGKHIG